MHDNAKARIVRMMTPKSNKSPPSGRWVRRFRHVRYFMGVELDCNNVSVISAGFGRIPVTQERLRLRTRRFEHLVDLPQTQHRDVLAILSPGQIARAQIGAIETHGLLRHLLFRNVRSRRRQVRGTNHTERRVCSFFPVVADFRIPRRNHAISDFSRLITNQSPNPKH